MKSNVAMYCGWGRVVFAQSFDDPESLAAEMLKERPGQRDIAAYVSRPHVVLSYAPQQLFLDPSDMRRLELERFDGQQELPAGIEIRRLEAEQEASMISDLYAKRDMVPSDANFIWRKRNSDEMVLLVAADAGTGAVLGTVTGLDHAAILDDPSAGSSLWCLAVDPTAAVPGIGEALVRHLAGRFKDAGRPFMDLSVIHDNDQAKALYEKIGFQAVHYFAVKNKNAYNETLFIGPDIEEKLNPYARIIVDEARTRGINVEVLDGDEGYFRLSRGGKSVVCRESLSELTTAIAMSRCQDKYVTHRWLSRAGISTPSFHLAGSTESNEAFLEEHARIVVKPVIGEQGKGITVGVETPEALAEAIASAERFSERVLLESFHKGQDLRVVVINSRMVAAAVRRPAQVVGDGELDALTLIKKQSRRRAAATSGESAIPIDAETERCLAKSGYALDSIIPRGERVPVRSTANLHTGGTIHDVTDLMHPRLVEAARRAAQRLEIPVVGLDFIVDAPDQPRYVIIEANERVGLANHEPQPTAQRFVDMLFPLSVKASHRNTADSDAAASWAETQES